MKTTLLIIILYYGISMSQDINLADNLYYNYEKYKEHSLSNRRIKFQNLLPLIEQMKTKKHFSVTKLGKSSEGRELFLIKIGHGKTKVFLWSQMHGDESTATMALFDIFNFFSFDDELNNTKNEILSNVTLYFLPMVNPDGAEYFQRRNIFSIDINRDANELETPEAKILMNTFDTIKADFGFNLHDQSTRYTCGKNFKTAAISFLAPAFNYEKQMNPSRLNAVKLIGRMIEILSKYIPGHIAKYSDDYEPRAFGDLFQKKGTSTILIESGGWEDDIEKQFIRKLNFISLVTAFNSIAAKNFENVSENIYEQIPFNDKYLYDLILRRLTFQKNDLKYQIDLGINFNEINTNAFNNFYYQSIIEDLGDLSIYYGNKDYYLEGYTLEEGKTFPKILKSYKEIELLNFNDLYKEGFINLQTNFEPKENYSPFPINLISSKKKGNKNNFLGKAANFIIKKNDTIKYVVINGFVFDAVNQTGTIKNGLTFK